MKLSFINSLQYFPSGDGGFTLEIAVFNIQSALLAEKAGANRIELCENPVDGGTTPSYGTLKTTNQPEYKWWQGALALIVVTAIGALSAGSKKKTRKIYEKQQKQAPWAPPAWLFGPAWTLNNIFLVWGLRRILNNTDMPNRKKLLLLQALIWADFLTFGYVYFKKGSPILAEAWTQTDALLALVSFFIALKSDKKLSYAYVPLLIWTWFASSLSAYQALYNADPVFGTKALLK